MHNIENVRSDMHITIFSCDMRYVSLLVKPWCTCETIAIVVNSVSLVLTLAKLFHMKIVHCSF